MIRTVYPIFGDLDNLKVVYEYLDNDEWEVWLEILEVYVDGGKTNVVEYIKPEFLKELALDLISSHKEY